MGNDPLLELELLEMPIRPRVYCASPWSRAKMWRADLRSAFIPKGADVVITSSWHEFETLPETDSDTNPDLCLAAWARDLAEIRVSDFLVAYAEHKDRPNGTLFEAGYASSFETPVLLVGNFEWGTWRYLPNVTHYESLRKAFEAVTGVPYNDAT